MRGWLVGLIGLMAAGAAAAQIPDAPPSGDTAPVDYTLPSRWICRPGVDDGTCSTNLDAIAIDAKGARSPASYVAAKNAAVDCFYVYPTVSADKTMFSDLTVSRGEEERSTHAQAARLGAHCRLFVPIYHQLTLTALNWALVPGVDASKVDFDTPYRDVLAAWHDYLKRDNHGRGVILIGHSQGAILLKRLIAEEIDGKPAQKLLVAAYLAGNTGLTRSSFTSITPCAAAGQTGCIVAWSTYLDSATGPRFFAGGTAADPALCVNPASVSGGRGLLKSYLSRPALAPETDPPYIEIVGQISAECVTDDAGTVLRVRVEPGPFAAILNAALTLPTLPPSWGLHILDINLVQGNMLDLMESQIAAWRGGSASLRK